jgi:hypothetical protein
MTEKEGLARRGNQIIVIYNARNMRGVNNADSSTNYYSTTVSCEDALIKLACSLNKSDCPANCKTSTSLSYSWQY